MYYMFFFFKATATTEIYTLSLHDALPILVDRASNARVLFGSVAQLRQHRDTACAHIFRGRSEEHTSELQSRFDLVCRLLLEKKNTPTRTGLTSRTSPARSRVTASLATAPR